MQCFDTSVHTVMTTIIYLVYWILYCLQFQRVHSLDLVSQELLPHLVYQGTSISLSLIRSIYTLALINFGLYSDDNCSFLIPELE